MFVQQLNNNLRAMERELYTEDVSMTGMMAEPTYTYPVEMELDTFSQAPINPFAKVLDFQSQGHFAYPQTMDIDMDTSSINTNRPDSMVVDEQFTHYNSDSARSSFTNSGLLEAALDALLAKPTPTHPKQTNKKSKQQQKRQESSYTPTTNCRPANSRPKHNKPIDQSHAGSNAGFVATKVEQDDDDMGIL